MIRKLSLFLLTIFLYGRELSAEDLRNGNDSLLGVRELSEQGRHIEALKIVTDNSRQVPLSDLLYGAKSAWALGLVDQARSLWDKALRHKDCTGNERGRTLLARALLEFQESKFEQSRSFAEEGTSLLPESELRGELWYVIGESLSSQGMSSLAEQYLEKSIKEGTKERKQEALYRLALVQNQLGKTTEARDSLTKVELTSSVTPQAIKELIRIDMKRSNYGGMRTWIAEGRNSHPSSFNDPETSYLHITALVGEGLEYDAAKELEKTISSFSDTNPWVALSQAVIEESFASKRIKESQ